MQNSFEKVDVLPALFEKQNGQLLIKKKLSCSPSKAKLTVLSAKTKQFIQAHSQRRKDHFVPDIAPFTFGVTQCMLLNQKVFKNGTCMRNHYTTVHWVIKGNAKK